MLKKEEIESIINDQIRSKEKLGNHGSTSGHMSHMSYTLNDFKYEETKDGNTSVVFSYTIVVETEFTYYPDNPPYEYYNEYEMLIDNDGKVISDKIKEQSSNFEFELGTPDDILFEVRMYLENILEKIEWQYGDNRAPFKYPPELVIIEDEKRKSKYICILETDFGEDDEKLRYESDTPEGLLREVKKDIPSRFNMNLGI